MKRILCPVDCPVESRDRHGRPGLGLLRGALELVLQKVREVAQYVKFLQRYLARLRIDNAQGAHFQAGGFAHRNAGVKANVRWARYQGIGGEPRIARGVFYQQYPVLVHRVVAERHAARRFRDVQTPTRLEPLAVFVQQREQRDGCFIEAAGDFHQPVKAPLCVGVEYAEAVQGRKATLLLRFGGHGVEPGRLPTLVRKVCLLSRHAARQGRTLPIGNTFLMSGSRSVTKSVTNRLSHLAERLNLHCIWVLRPHTLCEENDYASTDTLAALA